MSERSWRLPPTHFKNGFAGCISTTDAALGKAATDYHPLTASASGRDARAMQRLVGLWVLGVFGLVAIHACSSDDSSGGGDGKGGSGGSSGKGGSGGDAGD